MRNHRRHRWFTSRTLRSALTSFWSRIRLPGSPIQPLKAVNWITLKTPRSVPSSTALPSNKTRSPNHQIRPKKKAKKSKRQSGPKPPSSSRTTHHQRRPRSRRWRRRSDTHHRREMTKNQSICSSLFFTRTIRKKSSSRRKEEYLGKRKSQTQANAK